MLYAVLVQPILASTTVSRGFEPVKSIALAVAVGALGALSLLRGERWSLESGAPTMARVAAWLAAVIGAFVTLSVLFAEGDRWTAILGGLGRRQGWVTEVSELLVLAAAAWAVSRRALSLSSVMVLAVVAAAGVSTAAMCQSHWVRFLDPTRWSAEVFNRVAGTMGSASQLDTYLALTLPLTAGLGFDAARRRARTPLIALSLAFAVQVVALVFARGRTGTVGAILGIFILVILLPASSRRVRALRNVALALFVGSSLFVVSLNVPGSPVEKLIQGDGPVRHLLQRLAHVTDFESGGGRVRALLAEATEKSFARRPAAWIVGFGPDLEWDALAPFDTVERGRIEGFDSSQDRPHQFASEKLMVGGAPYAFAWLGILCLAAAAAMRRLVRRVWAVALSSWAAGILVFFAVAILVGRPGFAPAASAPAGAAALLCWILGIAVVRGLGRGSEPVDASTDAILETSVLAALVSHLIAGSFGVSMGPERTLVWALAGCVLAAPQREAAIALVAASLPRRAGLLIGAACCGLVSFYSYHTLGWESLDRVYAALITPAVLVGVAAAFLDEPKRKFFVEVGVLVFVGIGIVLALAPPSGKADPLAPQHWRNASWIAPLLVAATLVPWLIATRREAAPGGALSPISERTLVHDLRPIAAALLVCATAIYGWIGFRELRSDTAMFAALRLNLYAGALEKTASDVQGDEKKDALMAEALRVNGIALELVQVAREEGAPLAVLGCPSVHDRVIESERP